MIPTGRCPVSGPGSEIHDAGVRRPLIVDRLARAASELPISFHRPLPGACLSGNTHG